MSEANDPQSGRGRPLPRKEADLFTNVVKFYESKQYKKGLKNADLILRRFPNHGETLCMKGLIVNAVADSSGGGGGGGGGRKGGSTTGGGGGGDKKGGGDRGSGGKEEEGTDKRKEAIELVKRGLMMDMRSHVCWHVYGLLHRSSRNYSEAIKAYKQALRIDPENLQILRDMGLLQVQMRDLDGFRSTRLRILTLRPNSKVHWLTYALATHVCGDPEGAASVIDSYTGTLDRDSAEFSRNFESSELAMYKNLVLSETDGGEDGLEGTRRALRHLDEASPLVLDRTGWLRARLSYQLRLGMHDDAARTAKDLFDRGSTEDHSVHGAYMCALLGSDARECAEAEALTGTGTLATLRPLDDDERETLLRAYGEEDGEGLAAAHPRSGAIRRIRLTLLRPGSAEAASALDQHCRRGIAKGVPSLGWDLSALYLMEEKRRGGDDDKARRYVLATDPADVRRHPVHLALAELADSYITSLESDGAFPRREGEEEEEEECRRPGPSALLWAWYLRAVLHEQAAEHAAGLALVEKCIGHTPTAVDFYELRGRLLEAGGDVRGAADAVDAGRDLDRQDRYVNNLAARTLLRAGRTEEARARMAMFTRHEGNPEENLYDMQCTWYELELADCLRRRGELGRAWRKYMAVIKHYQDFHEDQFDFHMYCIRKVTLRSYCKLLKFEDELWGMPHYGRAAEEVIKIHLHLADHPAQAKEDEEPDYSKMTPAQRKKAKNIARKKAKKKKAGGKADEKNGNDNGKDGGSAASGRKKSKPHVVDEDPEGKELLALDHLEEARKHAAILVRHAPRRISAWALQYDVSIRRGRTLLALQALFKMRAVDPADRRLFSRVVDYHGRTSSPASAGTAISSEVISSEVISSEVISSSLPGLTNGAPLEEFVASAAEGVEADGSTGLPLRVAVAKAALAVGEGGPGAAAALVLGCDLDSARNVTVENCREALNFVESLDNAREEGDDGDGRRCSYKERMTERVAAKFPFAKDF